MKNIFVHDMVDSAALSLLKAMPGVRVEVVETNEEEEREFPATLLADKHILFCCLPPKNVRDMVALELIQISSVGYSQLYGLDLVKKGVRACNAAGVFDVPIGEWNMAMMVNLGRNVRGMIRNQEAGVWERRPEFENEMRGRVVGLWGYGGIGRETARLCKAMGLTVHALTRSGVGPRRNVYCVPGVGDPEGFLPDRCFTIEHRAEFLAGLDFLVLAMPLTPATRGIIGEAELKCLPNRAFILNPARGPLIQEEALVRALEQGWIAGAALDTHYHYPMPADHPLWRFPNVIMTPHISGSTMGPNFKARMWDIFSQNVRRFLAGQPLLNELTPVQLSGG